MVRFLANRLIFAYRIAIVTTLSLQLLFSLALCCRSCVIHRAMCMCMSMCQWECVDGWHCYLSYVVEHSIVWVLSLDANMSSSGISLQLSQKNWTDQMYSAVLIHCWLPAAECAIFIFYRIYTRSDICILDTVGNVMNKLRFWRATRHPQRGTALSLEPWLSMDFFVGIWPRR